MKKNEKPVLCFYYIRRVLKNKARNIKKVLSKEKTGRANCAKCINVNNLLRILTFGENGVSYRQID